MSGLVLDTGALLAMRVGARTCRITLMLAAAYAEGLPIRLPTVVLAEWWGDTVEHRFLLSRLRRVASPPAPGWLHTPAPASAPAPSAPPAK